MAEISKSATSRTALDTTVESNSWRGLRTESVSPAPAEGASQAHSRLAVVCKRGTDILLSSLALIILAPVLPLIALAIKIDSRGPVIFRQPRVGRGGRVFEMLKFRTMEDGADNRRSELHHLNENDGILFKSSVDPRVTRVGRLLRPLSLDELPQLWQVLTGTMSLVGPRAMPPQMDDQIDQTFRAPRLTVRPGITGPWQIDRTGRRRSIQEMARMDDDYVRTWSPAGDLGILLRTAPYVLGRRGV